MSRKQGYFSLNCPILAFGSQKNIFPASLQPELHTCAPLHFDTPSIRHRAPPGHTQRTACRHRCHILPLSSSRPVACFSTHPSTSQPHPVSTSWPHIHYQVLTVPTHRAGSVQSCSPCPFPVTGCHLPRSSPNSSLFSNSSLNAVLILGSTSVIFLKDNDSVTSLLK